MDITSTTQITRYEVKQAEKLSTVHNDHDPKYKHSNRTIQPDETKMNQHIKFAPSLRDTLTDFWQPKIDKDNQKLELQYKQGKLSKYNYEKRQKTVDGYLGGSKRPVVNFVVTLGNADTTRDLMDKLGVHYTERSYYDGHGNKLTEPHVDPKDQQKWSTFCNEAFNRYAKWLNNRGFAVSQYWVHLDEGGAPHMHIETVPIGHTKTGKPSMNPNNAIKEFLNSTNMTVSKDTRTNMREFRRVSDTALVDCFNATAKQQGYNIAPLILTRTGRPSGLSMTDYKKLQVKKDELQTQQKHAQQAIKQENENSKKLKDELKQLKKKTTEDAFRSANDHQLKLNNQALKNISKPYQQLTGKQLKMSDDVDNLGFANAVYTILKVSKSKVSDAQKSEQQKTNLDEKISQLSKQVKDLQQQLQQHRLQIQRFQRDEEKYKQREQRITNRENKLKKWIDNFSNWLKRHFELMLNSAYQRGYEQRGKELNQQQLKSQKQQEQEKESQQALDVANSASKLLHSYSDQQEYSHVMGLNDDSEDKDDHYLTEYISKQVDKQKKDPNKQVTSQFETPSQIAKKMKETAIPTNTTTSKDKDKSKHLTT